ncbi:MAG: HAD family hydrolase [Candidatus Nanoarchaeia archaeon]
MKYKLLIFDIDGVIFKDPNFWMEVHRKFGTLDQGKVLTKKYLSSDYSRLVEEVVVKLWKGKDAAPYYELINSLEYLKGVRETFEFAKQKKYLTALVSASSIDLAKRVQKDFEVNYIFANELVIKEGKVSGEFVWPIGEGTKEKAEIIRKLCRDIGISEKECIYIGDSKKDIDAFREVGKSIAFNSTSEELKKAATHVVDSDNLSDVIKYL